MYVVEIPYRLRVGGSSAAEIQFQHNVLCLATLRRLAAFACSGGFLLTARKVSAALQQLRGLGA